MLLLHSSESRHARYSHYLAAILGLEGFVDFAELDLTTLDAATLAAHDLVILPRVALTQARAELLQNYVTGGGRLIALMPDPNFARRFGVAPTWRGVDHGWLRLDAAQPILQGIPSQPVQIVVPTVGWTLAPDSGTTALAQVGADKATPAGETQPALVWCQAGQGRAVFFAYDLAHAVARLRQGNPEHADLSYAGLDGIVRPSELFVGQLDEDQMRIPQADVHTALLARLVETLAPRPRLWYYPQPSQRSALIMTSDDDWSTVEQFEALLNGLRQRQATCTFYVVPETKINNDLIARWEEDGHTFSVHPALDADINRALAVDEPQSTQVAAMLHTNIKRHAAEHGRPVHTIRQHAVRWLGYVEAARILADLGVAMDLNYVSVHPFSLGYLAGSGRPLPFVETDGLLIPCYQQPTMWTEEVLIHPRFVFSFKWTVERALQEVDQMVQDATEIFYTPVTINSHPVSFATYSSPLIDGTWERAQAARMPILSPDRWLAWVQAREAVRIEWNEQSCVVYTPTALARLTVLLPPDIRAAPTATASTEHLWGRDYLALTLTDLAAGERRIIASRPAQPS
jgi:hypothetical protein